MPSLATGLAIGITALIAIPLLAVATTGASPDCNAPGIPTTTAGVAPDATQDIAVAWDSDQRAVAATIVSVGQARGMPPRAQVIALATAMQESGLRNLPGGDRDSVGVFQQRPSQGWGTPAQLTSVAYQAATFYAALSAVPGWQTIPVAQAAQAVQRSGFPQAYARWATAALALHQQIAGIQGTPDTAETVDTFVGMSGCAPTGGDGLPDTQATLPPGFTLPPGTPAAVTTAVTWALAQLGTPYSYGGDCTAPHSGDPTRACDCSTLIILS